MFPIKNGLKKGHSLSSIISNFAFEYAIRRGQVNLDGMKLNDIHQLLVYADGVNILGEKNTYCTEKQRSFSIAE